MAWSSAEVAAADLTSLAAGNPCLFSVSSYKAISVGRWVSSTTGTFSDSDITTSGYPVTRAFDGQTDLKTVATSADTTCALLMDFGATGITFDTLAMVNHNLASATIAGMTLDVADDNAFSSNKVTPLIYAASPSMSRTAWMSLYHTGAVARVYSAVRYVRLTITFNATNSPSIGEILFLRRQQFGHKPMRPYDPVGQTSTVAMHESRSGKVQTYTMVRGRREVRYSWQLRDSTDATKALNLWRYTQQGTQPFVLCDDPYSAPNTFYLLRWASDSPTIQLPYSGPVARTFDLEADEVGPNFLELEAT